MGALVKIVTIPERKWVGQAVRRKEDLRLLRGEGQFIDDFKLPGLLHVVLLPSPYAHARIKRIDISKALKSLGVVAVFTGKDIAELTDPFPQISPLLENKLKDYSMAVEKVRFVGEPVAAVVAESRYQAQDAAELIEVEYEALPPVLDAEKALERDSPVLHEEVGSNLVWHGVWEYGDLDTAFREADKVVKAKLHFHRFNSAPLETNGVLASYDRTSNYLTIWCNNQMPMFCQGFICIALRFPSNRMRIITQDIGGGFGCKIISYPFMVLISAISMKLGRPVKWTDTRREYMMSASHGNERTFYVELAAKKDGTITALKAKAFDDTGGYPRYEPAGCVIWAQVTPGCYRFQNFYMDFYQVVTNKCPVGPNRGYSRMQHLWMIEKAVDLVARELGLDPAEVRRKNYIRPDEMPYVTPSGGVYDGGDYPESLRRALTMIDYEKMKVEQQKLRDKGRYLGIGFATILDSGTNNFSQVKIISEQFPLSGNSEAARVTIDHLGNVIVALGTVPQGHGHETAAAQIVADELGVSPDQVYVLPGFDSATHPYTGHSGTYASSFAVKAGGAILGAAGIIKEKMMKIAANLLKAGPEEIELRDGAAWVRGTDKSVSLWQIANAAWANYALLPPDMPPGLTATYVFRPDFKLPDEKKRLNQTLTYSYQTHAAVVELDAQTGKVEILKYVVVDDVGTPINPQIVEGQVHGAAAHGIAASLYENFVYANDGQLLTSTFADYLAPGAEDMPDIELNHLITPSLFAPLGARGVGEGGGTPLATLVNAVEDALEPLGIRIYDSHIAPETLFRALKEHGPIKKASGKRS